MADLNEEDSMYIQKNDNILVSVVEALEDIIIVSFKHENKLFEGALLNSTKKNCLPCGIIPPKDFLQPPPIISSPKPEDNPLSPVGLTQRYTYFQQDKGSLCKNPLINIRRTIKPPSRYRKPNSKMTVRLRPRQVLCSKCRSICTENSENVDVTPSRSTRRNPSPINRKILNASTVESSELNSTSKNNDDIENIVDKIISSTEKIEDSNAKLNKIKIVGNYWISPTRENSDDKFDDDADSNIKKENNSGVDLTADDQDKMVLRKKRSVGSMEDLWEESVFEEGAKKLKLLDNSIEPPRTTTPVIKISFGTSGQGTVLKIPSKIQIVDGINTLEENLENKYKNTKDIVGNKAAKKALKKAKKDSRRKMFGSPNQSPSSNLEIPRRHKHKLKHRKKHKESKHREDGEPTWKLEKSKTDSDYSAIKEQCLKQRLSISLKRLNANAYMRCDSTQQLEDSTASNSCSPDSSSPDCSEEVPDFPPSAINPNLTEPSSNSSTDNSPTLMMRISTQAVQSCLTGDDGRKMSVGDVVWGKIHGFPWWPGKVLSISVSRKDDGVCLAPHAHVAWYASSTSSLMPCDQLCPFLETFKTRYNKKKRGPYKEAIRQATSEAQLVSVPSAASPTQILSVTSSPREVNVLS